MAGIGLALETARLRSGEGPNRDAPGLKRIKNHLKGLQEELSKLTPWQRAELDLAADQEARAWLRSGRKEATEAAVVEIVEKAPTREAHESAAGESADVGSPAIEEVPSGPKTMLARVEPISEDGITWRVGFSSDYLLDRFQWDCNIFTAAAGEVIASYADLPPQHKYVGPPPAIIHLIALLGHSWRCAFDQEPDDEPNGAFGRVIGVLLTALGIKESLGAKSLKRALKH